MRKVWECIKITVSYWGAMILGPLVLSLLNAISAALGYGYMEGSLGFAALTFLAQPISCGAAYAIANEISDGQHSVCVAVNGFLQIIFLVVLVLFSQTWLKAASLGLSLAVTFGCMVRLVIGLVKKRNE